jgi:hypothetical protein
LNNSEFITERQPRLRMLIAMVVARSWRAAMAMLRSRAWQMLWEFPTCVSLKADLFI